MAKSTMYITIPKERAAGILTGENSKYFVKSDDDGIIIHKSTLSSTHRATLTDYKIPDARLESSGGSVETGKIGTKVEYSHSHVREELEEYEI